MNPKLNLFDRIMMAILALAVLVIWGGLCATGEAPAGAQWGLAIAGLAYVLYQAIHLGSPRLTAATAAVVMVGYLGPVVVDWRFARDFLANNIWDPLGHYSLAAIAVTAILVVLVALPLEAGVLVAWMVQRVRRGRQAPPPSSGSHVKEPPALSGTAGPPPMPPTLPGPAGPA